MPLSALQSGAVREARLQDALVQSFADELEQALILLNSRLRRLLRQFDTEGGRLVGTLVSIGQAMAMREAILDALEDAGYTRVLRDAVDAPLDRLAAEVLRTNRTAGLAATQSRYAVEALAAFKELRLAQLLDLAEDTASAVWRTVLDGVIGARPVDDLLDDLIDVLDASRSVAQRTYDTAVSIYTREVGLLHSTGEPGELFLYVGPVDGKTRPFCLERVGKVYTRAEIDQWDNGQLSNPLVTGGGYNCRHVARRVSVLDDEVAALVATGERLPEVEAQLAALEAA